MTWTWIVERDSMPAEPGDRVVHVSDLSEPAARQIASELPDYVHPRVKRMSGRANTGTQRHRRIRR